MSDWATDAAFTSCFLTCVFIETSLTYRKLNMRAWAGAGPFLAESRPISAHSLNERAISAQPWLDRILLSVRQPRSIKCLLWDRRNRCNLYGMLWRSPG